MHFSLILTTAGRREELRTLFASLRAQTHQDFDLIVIDQNADDRLADVVTEFQPYFPLQYVKSDKRGHSTGINSGLAYATGDIVAFPDDDCWYPDNLLAIVNRRFEADPALGGVTGRENTGNWETGASLVNRHNLWNRHISFTMFFRRQAIVGMRFDESMGVCAGTLWGAGEETDFLLRVLERHPVLYDSQVLLFHPQWAQPPFTPKKLAKARAYGMGAGHVLRLHRYGLATTAYHLSRPMAAAIVNALRGRWGKARFHWEFFLGRTVGWLRTGRRLPASPDTAFGAELTPGGSPSDSNVA